LYQTFEGSIKCPGTSGSHENLKSHHQFGCSWATTLGNLGTLYAHCSLTVMFGVKWLEMRNKNSMSKQNKTKQLTSPINITAK